jgi:RNA polymerase sigma factor (sigma-70 family)
MLLKLNGVGNQRIKYKQVDNESFDNLEDYLILAKKSISKFANSTYSGLAKKMLKDEDAISAVANAIMMADWRWDENYTNQKGTKKTKYSYRNQCAIWAIQTYATTNAKHHKKIKDVYSLDYTNENLDIGGMHNCIYSTTDTPEEILIDREKQNTIQEFIDYIMNLESLTARQKDYINLYYLEGFTFEKIGNKYGITREAVRQGLNKAIDSIKEAVNV